MWEMPFYDIMLLYNAYEKHVKEENESQQEMQQKYEEEHPMPSASDFKMPDINSLSRGMFDAAKMNFPGLN